MPPPDHLSEEEAVRLWRRAAELQAEAARREESDGPDPGEEAGGEDAAGGYALTHVRAAAIEAGIGEEYVEAALADLRAEKALAAVDRRGPRRLSRLILGGPPETVAARRRIVAPPDKVLRAMEAVLPHEPYNLTLRDREGDPMAGGTLVFDITGAGFSAAGSAGFAGEASWADLRQVHARLQRALDQESAVDVTVRAPVAWAWRLNAGFAGVFGVMGGGLGAAVGSAGGALAAALLGGTGVAAVVAGLLVAGSTAGGGVGGVWGYRALYRYALRRGESALTGMLGAVVAEAEGGWGLAPDDG